jgi:hypothetical protein
VGRGDDYIGHADKTLDRERFQECPRLRSLQVGPVGRGLSPTVEGCTGMGPNGPIWAMWSLNLSPTPFFSWLSVNTNY